MRNFQQFLSEKILLKYNDKLNPAFWDEKNQLKPQIRSKLLAIANAWIIFSNISQISVKQIILTGSSANYNWVPGLSDIDVHVIVDFNNAVQGMDSEAAQDYLYDKKVLWAIRHPNIKISMYPVELFAQSYEEYLDYLKDSAQRGVYSLTNNKWLVQPNYQVPEIFSNMSKVQSKVSYRKRIINNLIMNKNYGKLKEYKNRLIASRGKGLKKDGEFSDLNLTYKQLRAEGYLDKINKALADHEDLKYSF